MNPELFDKLFSQFAFFGFGWLAFWIILSIIYGFNKSRSIEPFDATNVLFYENFVSGRSMKNIFTQLGGARNCLKVSVNNQELFIRPFPPFNLMFLPEFFDLEHRIPLTQIISVQENNSFARKVISIEFRNRDSQIGTIELFIKNADKFINLFPLRKTNAA